MAAPDFAEALIGWRVWCVVETSAGLRLASVIHDHLWDVDRPALAACSERHAAPEAGCACGIHATREPAPVLPYLRGRDGPGTVARILGRVALWGTVVEHEHGWRASRAYPVELWLPPELDGLGGAYGVREQGRIADAIS